MWKSGHNWPDLRRHLPSLKIAPRIWASSCLIGKSLFGNVCLPLTNRPATAADLCIKNTLFFFPFPLLFQRKIRLWDGRLHLNHSLASASNVGMCFPHCPCLETLSAWRKASAFCQQHDRTNRTVFLPKAIQLEKPGVWRLKALLNRTRYSNCGFGDILL